MNNIINKQELAKLVAGEADVDVTLTLEVIERTFDLITRALITGKEVRIIGFGTFFTKTRSARTGTDPNTHLQISLPQSRTAKFRAGEKLQQKLKQH